MKQAICGLIRRYGQTVTLRLAEGDVTVQAFLQPMSSRGEQSPEAITALGTIDGRLWRYLGETSVEAGDEMEWNGTVFSVRSSRPYYSGDTLLYWWAALEQAKEVAEE